MRGSRFLYAWASAFVAILGLQPTRLVGQGKPAPPPRGATETERRPEKDDPQARLDATRAWFGGDPSPEYLDAKKRIAAEVFQRFEWSFPGYKATGRPIAAVPGSNLTWTNIGPTGGNSSYAPPGGGDVDSGRLAIQGILTHPTNPQILYIGTAGGGVWKTTNADLNATGDWTWTCITDNLPVATGTGNCAVGAIAMSPTDPETIYLGLGDAFAAQGRGIYKSTNGGSTWTELGALGNTTFITFILPLDANVILVGGNNGIWRTSNGGSSFGQLSGSAGLRVWSFAKLTNQDLAITTTDSNGGNGAIYYSADGGQSFLPSSGISGSGRITLAASPSSATTIWGISEDRTQSGYKFRRGLLKSIDKGASWSFILAPNTPGSLFNSTGAQPDGDGTQAFYNHCISVDPNDVNKVFVGSNLSLYRTINGGITWEQLTHWLGSSRPYAHADWHTNSWSKTGPSVLFLGNDGGLSILRDPYRTPPTGPLTSDNRVQSDPTFIDTRRNSGLSTHLIYNVGSTTALTPSSSRWRVVIGLQDNSTRTRRAPGSSLFDETAGTGDGLVAYWHPSDANKLITAAPYGAIRISLDSGQSWPLGGTLSDPFGAPFWTRLTGNPSDVSGNTLITATISRFWISTNFGSNWVFKDPFVSQPIRNINASKSNPNAYALVTGGGFGRVTTDGGTTWQSLGTFPGLTTAEGPISDNGYVALSYIWFDTSNHNTIYVASASYTFNANHLWKSTNLGASWTALDGPGSGFPAGPVHVIQNDPTNPATLLAGTDYGVFISTNAGTTWTRYGQGLPMVAVRDLYIAPDGKFIRAATFGRGVWEIGDSTEPGGGETTTQLLQNPGFESGNTVWAASNTDIINPSSVQNMQVRNGTWGAWISGYGVVHTDTLSQDVVIPSNATHVELNFWLKMATAETGGVANDTLKVQIRNTSGGVLGTLANLSNLDASAHASFVKKSYDITQFKGQTIRVYLEGSENASLQTSFWVDDFELNSTTSTATAPSITQHPQGLTINAGQTAVFNVTATGTAPLAYQWRKGGANIGGATTATYTINNAQTSDAGSYDVVVSNSAGSATSNPAVLTVNAGSTAPTITGQPATQTVTAGQSVSFTVTATGTAPLAYQWRKGGATIAGATSATYTFTATYADNGAQYSVVVSNAAGSATSNNAGLTVNVKNRDLSGDGVTNVLDLATFMAAYSGSGIPTSNPAADLDGDGDCDDADLALLLAAI